jgi:hypothetical protein
MVPKQANFFRLKAKKIEKRQKQWRQEGKIGGTGAG